MSLMRHQLSVRRCKLAKMCHAKEPDALSNVRGAEAYRAHFKASRVDSACVAAWVQLSPVELLVGLGADDRKLDNQPPGVPSDPRPTLGHPGHDAGLATVLVPRRSSLPPNARNCERHMATVFRGAQRRDFAIAANCLGFSQSAAIISHLHGGRVVVHHPQADQRVLVVVEFDEAITLGPGHPCEPKNTHLLDTCQIHAKMAGRPRAAQHAAIGMATRGRRARWFGARTAR